jgi:hypothetical protein
MRAASPRRWAIACAVNLSAWACSTTSSRSHLFSNTNVATLVTCTVSSRSSSARETGGSAVSMNTAASIVSSGAWAAAVLCTWTDPVPGVSIKSIPPLRIGASSTTVTWVKPSVLCGLPASVTRPGSAVSGWVSR